MTGCSTTDAIFALRQLQEKIKEGRKHCAVPSLTFKKGSRSGAEEGASLLRESKEGLGKMYLNCRGHVHGQ